MDRELWYASSGPLLFDDEEIATLWYPAPYDTLALRAALLSQAYVTDTPVLDLEVARRMDIDGTPGTILKAGASGLPADSLITEDATYILISSRILSAASMRLTTSPGAGKVIKGDADGDFEWDTLSGLETDPVWVAWIGTVRAVNTVFAGPATGPSAVPTFRSLVVADIPDISGTYLTPGAHTAIGNSAPHHAAITLATAGDTLLGLSSQVLDLDTQAANLLFAGPVSGAVAAPTFRALVDADFPATLNPTLAGLGATPIITSYAGPHAIGGSAQSNAQLFLSGSFVGANLAFGLFANPTLTPTGAFSAYSAYIQGALNMVANQVHSVFAALGLVAPTINAASGASVTEATTLRVFGAPTAGVSNYAVNIVAGASRFGALTASLPIVTDSDKVLASLAYTGATSFRKNLGLETDDSPTFDQGNFTTLHTTTILTDHVGEHGSAHTVVFDNTVTLPASTIVPDAGTIGLGAGKGLIQFDDETTDFVSFLNCNVGIGTATPQRPAHISGNSAGLLSILAIENIGNTDLNGALISFRMPTSGAGASTFVEMAGIQTDFVLHNHATRSADIQLYSSTAGTFYALILKGNGRVGIGTLVPGVKLQVQSAYSASVANTGQLRLSETADYYGSIGYDEAGDTQFVFDNNYGTALSTISFRFGNVPFVTILGSGKVGIGDVAPGELLDVAGNINLTGVLKIDDVQVVSNRVVDATINNSIEAAFTALYPLASALLAGIQTAIKTHGLMAAA